MTIQINIKYLSVKHKTIKIINYAFEPMCKIKIIIIMQCNLRLVRDCQICTGGSQKSLCSRVTVC